MAPSAAVSGVVESRHIDSHVVTTTRRIAELSIWTEAATVVALSVVLGNIRLLQLPAGGSISLAALPLVMFALVRGSHRAVLVGALAGTAHLLFGGTVIHPIQALLDYPVSYALLGLAGSGARHRLVSPRMGTSIGMLAQLSAITVSGTVFFAAVADIPDPWAYSLVYNASTQIPEMIIVALLAPSVVAAFYRVDAQFTGPRQTSQQYSPVPCAQPFDDAIRDTASTETVPRMPFQLPSLAAAMHRGNS